jgi:hypothetical protein
LLGRHRALDHRRPEAAEISPLREAAGQRDAQLTLLPSDAFSDG